MLVCVDASMQSWRFMEACTCSGGPDKQDPLGQLAPQGGKLLGVAQVLHYLLQLRLCRPASRFCKGTSGVT